VSAAAESGGEDLLDARALAAYRQRLRDIDDDLAEARSWVVYDRGADNDRLAALAPDRKAYLLDMEALRLEPLRTPSEY